MQEERDPASELAYTAGLTLREACLQASSLLERAGVSEPRSNSELLLMHMLGIERAQLLRDWREPMPVERWEAWRQLIGRKAEGEPVQYMIGEGWFYGRAFKVTPAVLIPRPETELLVEAVLEEADKLWPEASGDSAERLWPDEAETAETLGLGKGKPSEDSEQGGTQRSGGQVQLQHVSSGPRSVAPTVLDIGTGSGAIALTLAAERPAWRLYASDLSADALAVARSNAASLGAIERVAFVQGDLLTPFLAVRAGASEHADPAGLAVDIVVSNPPYIPAGDLAGLQREVRDYEPHLALDGGDDGLHPYRRMVEQLQGLSHMPRIVAFELGMGQAREVARLLHGCYAWSRVRIIEDYAGIERHVVAVR